MGKVYSRGFLKIAASSYRAPSWSWASIDIPIIIDYNDQRVSKETSKICNISVQIDLAGQNGFGAVKGGTLTLTGKLQKVEIELLTKLLGEESIWYLSFGDNARNIALDAGNVNAYLLDNSAKAEGHRLGKAYLDENREPGGPVLALQIDCTSGFLSQIGEDAKYRQNVLLLQEIREENRFRRIGKGRLCFKGSEERFENVDESRIVIDLGQLCQQFFFGY